MLSSRDVTPPSDQTAASPGGGCLSGYLLPPLAVIVVGFLLVFLSLGADLPAASAGRTITPAPLGTMDPPDSASFASLAPLFTPEVRHWAVSIRSWAAAAGLDPNLVATVMQIESCGNPNARSRSGAIGLFQVMPDHFYAGDDPYDPDTNALRGLAYLRRSLDAAGGDPRLALAGYNGGISVIARSETSWAAETQRYAYWGSGIYADAELGEGQSPRLQEWLKAGGTGLCRQAHQQILLAP